jgi:hypothetical protein
MLQDQQGAASNTSRRPTWLIGAVVALVAAAVVKTVVVEEVAGTLMGATMSLPGITPEDKVLPSRSAKFVINLTTPPLSVGIGLKKISSPVKTTRLQDIQRPTLLTPIGTLIVELPTTLQVSSIS